NVAQIRLGHRCWEGLRHEDLMSAATHGLVRELPLLLPEGKDTMPGVQDSVDGGGGETMVVGHVMPPIEIIRCGLRDVPTDPQLVCRRPACTEGLERADGGWDRLGSIMAGLQHREVVCHDLPARLPQKRSLPQ